jgi:hypothetical protein
MKPGFGRWSLMLCRRAIEMGSSLRFCAVRPSNKPCDDRRPPVVGDVGIAAGGLPVEVAEVVEAAESARSVRNLVVSAMVVVVWCVGTRLCCSVEGDVICNDDVGIDFRGGFKQYQSQGRGSTLSFKQTVVGER